MPEHVTITDPQIHEPKGAATATSGQVYTSDGAGGGAWTDRDVVSNVVIITSASDFPTPTLVGGVLTIVPEAVEYLVNQNITLTTPIGYPGAGLRTTLTSVNRSLVTYTGTDSAFRDPDAQGDIEVYGLSEVKAPNGNMWDITASTGEFSFQAVGPCRFTDCVALGSVDGGVSAGGQFNLFFGTLADFGQGLVTTNLSFFEVNTMFIGGNNAPSSTYFTIDGTSATGSANFFSNTVCIGANETLFDFNPEISSTIDNISILGNQLEGGLDGDVFAAGSLDLDSPSIFSTSNAGLVADSMADGLLYMHGNSTETVIAAASTPVLVAGTWSTEGVSLFTADAAGRLTYIGKNTIRLPISVVVTLTTTAGTDVVSVGVAKNGSFFINSAINAEVDFTAASPTSISTIWQVEVSTGDYLEVMVTNESDTDNLVVSDAVFRVN